MNDFGIVTRHIDEKVSLQLWAKAAGRCEFSGCNRILFESPVTSEPENLAQRAHIYSFSEDGPRGRGPYRAETANINSADNLMLMCHGCHKLIDDDKAGTRYSANLLLGWKHDHEERIRFVTGIPSDKKSNTIFYRANIGEQRALFDKNQALEAMFPRHYPANGRPIELSMKWSGEDRNASFWEVESRNLVAEFDRKVKPILTEADGPHFSVFALAPMPLLIKLGALFGDITAVDVYQFLRNPKGWNWQDRPSNFEFSIIHPERPSNPPVLVISVSASISRPRIYATTGENVSIWEISVPKEHTHNDCIRHPEQIAQFSRTVRQFLELIRTSYDPPIPLRIFPAMPVSCSVELGRLRMPKADLPWIIYDQNHNTGGFSETLTISGGDDATPRS